jgi:hypothetical protein
LSVVHDVEVGGGVALAEEVVGAVAAQAPSAAALTTVRWRKEEREDGVLEIPSTVPVRRAQDRVYSPFVSLLSSRHCYSLAC